MRETGSGSSTSASGISTEATCEPVTPRRLGAPDPANFFGLCILTFILATIVALPIAGFIIDSVGPRWLPVLAGLVFFAALPFLRSIESRPPKTSEWSRRAGGSAPDGDSRRQRSTEGVADGSTGAGASVGAGRVAVAGNSVPSPSPQPTSQAASSPAPPAAVERSSARRERR